MFKIMRRRIAAGSMAIAIVLANVMLPVMPVFAVSNNGTLQVHEKGTPEMTPSNRPHVCVFNFEAFGLDGGQTGDITITAQAPTAPITPVVISLTTDSTGNGSTSPYINDTGSAYALAGGHYKATLDNKFGTDKSNKAKSKVFWVNCDQSPQTPISVPTGYQAVCGRANDEITTTGDNFSVSVDTGWVQDGDSATKTTRTIDYVTDAGFVFAASAGWVLSENNTIATFVYTDWGDKCPQTIEPCVAITSSTIITKKKQFADSDDDRSAGHYKFTTDGLHIWTDDASSVAKVAWYHNVDYSLSEVGIPTMDYTANSGIKPGLQLRIDFDGNGTLDGTLIGEEVYGGDWWLSDNAEQFVKDGAPSHTGGSGSANHGTLNQWLTNFPSAQVQAIGFSLGSGVHADGILHSLTVGCHKYVFTAPLKPATPVAPTVYDVCYSDEDHISIPYTKGVVYRVDGIVKSGYVPYKGMNLVVTAEAKEGYVLAEGATISWTFGANNFTDKQCLEITKSAKVAKDTNLDGKIGIGDTVVWKITVTNTSDSAHEGFYVKVEDESVVYLQNDGYIGRLGAGESQTLIAKSVITEDHMRACKITNTAEFSGWRRTALVDRSLKGKKEYLPLAMGEATAEYVLDCTPGSGGSTPETPPTTPETPATNGSGATAVPAVMVLPNTSGASTPVVAISALSLASLILVAGTAIKSRLLA